ncbi:MAG: hypothetical protein AAGF60_12640 [Pseudomonadota bacterium]
MKGVWIGTATFAAAALGALALVTGGAGDAPRQDRAAALPEALQGTWVEVDEAQSVMTIAGGEITAFGAVVDYGGKTAFEEDGVLIVQLYAPPGVDADTFAQAHMTDLALLPDGTLHVFNVSFAAPFVRAAD